MLRYKTKLTEYSLNFCFMSFVAIVEIKLSTRLSRVSFEFCYRAIPNLIAFLWTQQYFAMKKVYGNSDDISSILLLYSSGCETKVLSSEEKRTFLITYIACLCYSCWFPISCPSLSLSLSLSTLSYLFSFLKMLFNF